MEKTKFNKQDCIALLQTKQQEIISQGQKRYPQRSDFSEEQVVAIKAFLGAWPRALEKAGLKPPRKQGEKNKEKRIISKRRRTEELKKSKEKLAE